MKHLNIDIALLLIRVGLSAVFLVHGWNKLSDMDSTIAFFSSLHLSASWAYLAALLETLGGLALLIGLFTEWASVLLAAMMLSTIALFKLSKGFLDGYELDLMLFLASIAIALAGPGKYALSRLWSRE